MTEGQAFPGAAACLLRTSGHLLSIYNQAGDVIFFSNNVSRPNIFTADKNRKVICLVRNEASIFTRESATLYEAPSFKPSKDYTFFNVTIYSLPFSKKRIWMCPSKGDVHKEFKGERTAVGTQRNQWLQLGMDSHSVLCVGPDKTALFWSNGNC